MIEWIMLGAFAGVIVFILVVEGVVIAFKILDKCEQGLRSLRTRIRYKKYELEPLLQRLRFSCRSRRSAILNKLRSRK